MRNEKSWGKKEAITQVPHSLPCCWRETSLFSELEERPAPQQQFIFNSSAPLQRFTPSGAPAWPDSGRAQFYNLMLSNLSSYVCSSSGRGWNTSRWWIQHSPSQCIEFYRYLLVLYRNKSNFMVCVEVGSYIRSLLLFALDDFMWLNPQIHHSGNAL